MNKMFMSCLPCFIENGCFVGEKYENILKKISLI